MIKLSFREPVYQETTTKEGLKKVVCTLVYRAKGIECAGGRDFVNGIGLTSRYKKAVGVAVCDPSDKYDPKIGRKIARSRAKDAAYTCFLNTIREKYTHYGNILAELTESVGKKTADVKQKNKEYRKKVVDNV